MPSRRSIENGRSLATLGGALLCAVLTLSGCPDTLTAPLAPTITSSPQSVVVVSGNSADFQVTASGDAPLSYRWQRNGSAIAGATSELYGLIATPADDGAVFRVIVSNAAGSDTSAAATLTVLVPPIITVQPLSQTAVVGTAVTFGVTAIGAAPLSYRWQRDFTDIPGATSATYTLTATLPDDGMAFNVIVSNAAGDAFSVSAVLTVLVPPFITDQPVSQTVASNAIVGFSVTADGTAPLSYQWQRDGTNIIGATSAAYTISNAAPADSGAVFRVIVSNAAGSVPSADATLTVVVPPTITVQPLSQTVVSGSPATFSVTASGSAPLSYQWQSDNFNITGATSTTYTVPAGFAFDGAVYRVIVSNAGGSSTSDPATLTVLTAPTITVQPVSQIVVSGNPAGFDVTANGSFPLSYQWYRNGAAIGGAKSEFYGLTAAPADSGAVFRVIVSNAAGSAISAGATLTVLVPPTITVQPIDQTVVSGTTVTFSVTATGSAPLFYRWQRDFTDIPGATSAIYTFTAAQADDGVPFVVFVSNTAGETNSYTVTLTVYTPPTITGQPLSQTVASGTIVTFSVTATGAPLGLQWQRNGADIVGAIYAAYTLTATAADHGAVFRAIASNAIGADTSAEATLTIANPPTITAQPVSLTVVSGASATFSVTATGDAPLSYQWQRNGSDVPGATGDTYTLAAAAPADHGAVFHVVVSNAVGNVTSAGATLTVLIPPTITAPPLSLTVASGSSASFGVTATGTAPLSYQWQRNGSDIGGATAAAYTLTAAAPADNGAVFRVIVSNAAASVISAGATLTVTSAPVISAAVAAGGSHSLALKADGTVWAWGGDGAGQLGNGAPMTDSPNPVQVSGLINVTQIAAGESHNLALKADGTVWAWGQNVFGQLGDGGIANSPTPVQVSGLTNVTRIAAGRRHSLAAKADGTVWAWGSNFYGQLGDGSNNDSNVPVLVFIPAGGCVPAPPAVCPGATAISHLAAGATHSLTQESGLFVWAWGDNFAGEIGGGIGTGGSTSPIQIGLLNGTPFLQLAAGSEFSLALKADSTILRWGLGVNLGAATPTPTAIGTLSGVAQIAAGYEHALALKSDGTVWGWGRNNVGQLTGNFSVVSPPAQAGFLSGAFLTGVQRIGAGVAAIHTLVLKQDGTVWAFGDDHNCKLGRGCTGTTFSRDPVQVLGLLLF